MENVLTQITMNNRLYIIIENAVKTKILNFNIDFRTSLYFSLK